MVRRNRALKAFGGAWVFPGGRVDVSDGPDLNPIDRARAAAIRETREETNLDISASKMEVLSNWIPPKAEIRRFSTWFFVTPAPDHQVTIDDGEIHEFQWVKPRDILAQTPDPQFLVMPPTYISLHRLSNFRDTDIAMDIIGKTENEQFTTKFRKTDDGFVTLWEGDAAYENLDFEAPGPRRRLYAGKRWKYESDFIPDI